MTVQEMFDKHFELLMDVAAASREIVHLQKHIEKANAELEILEAQIDAVEAKEDGKVC